MNGLSYKYWILENEATVTRVRTLAAIELEPRQAHSNHYIHTWDAPLTKFPLLDRRRTGLSSYWSLQILDTALTWTEPLNLNCTGTIQAHTIQTVALPAEGNTET